MSAIVVSALIGGVFGKCAQATADTVPDHYRTFTAALTAAQNGITGLGGIAKVRNDSSLTYKISAAGFRSLSRRHSAPNSSP